MRKVISYMFSRKPTHKYELFTFSDGGRELWRIDLSGKLYPETYFMKKWISDYGLGDYENNKKLAVKVEVKSEIEITSILPTFLHFDEIDFEKSLGKTIVSIKD